MNRNALAVEPSIHQRCLFALEGLTALFSDLIQDRRACDDGAALSFRATSERCRQFRELLDGAHLVYSDRVLLAPEDESSRPTTVELMSWVAVSIKLLTAIVLFEEDLLGEPSETAKNRFAEAFVNGVTFLLDGIKWDG